MTQAKQSPLVVTNSNVHLFSKDDNVRAYVTQLLQQGQIIVVSNVVVGQYVCTCTAGMYATFQRVMKTQ